MWRIIFDRKRLLAIEAWLAVPALLALAVQVGVGSYYHRGQEELDWRGSWAVLLPSLDAEAAASRAASVALTLSREKYASRLEALGTEFNSAARNAGFTIDSMTVDKSESEDGVTTYRVNLAGIGTIAAVARFLYTMQTNEYLMNVENARLMPLIRHDKNQYDLNILFQFSTLSPSQKR